MDQEKMHTTMHTGYDYPCEIKACVWVTYPYAYVVGVSFIFFLPFFCKVKILWKNPHPLCGITTLWRGLAPAVYNLLIGVYPPSRVHALRLTIYLRKK